MSVHLVRLLTWGAFLSRSRGCLALAAIPFVISLCAAVSCKGSGQISISEEPPTGSLGEIAKESDTTPPTVISVSPPQDAIAVSVGTQIAATFSEAMDSSSIGEQAIAVVKEGEPAVGGSLSYDPQGKTVTLTPTLSLANNSTFTATVAVAKDAAGNAMAAPFVWRFSTANILITQAPPARSHSDAARFEFTSSAAAFECALDSDTFAPCSSPAPWNGLSYGDHIFKVRGVGPDGRPATSPASHAWNISAQVSGGGKHACAIRTDGALYCWGYNAYGQIGDGTTVDKAVPTAASGGGGWSAVATGHQHTCGIKLDGTLHCWGFNSNGQLGNGQEGAGSSSPLPSGSASDRWIAVAAGTTHTCGIKTDGTLHCWGLNRNGQLGNGKSGVGLRELNPVAVGESRWLAVAAGVNHACGIKVDGGLFCWGSNGTGQLGDGTSADRSSPTAIGNERWSAVVTGINSQHTCGIKVDGGLFCWGSNARGQIGDGTYDDKLAPTAVSGADNRWKAVATGWHTCGVKPDNQIQCWGENSYGQLGDGTNETRLLPVAVATSDRWSSIAAGDDFTCAFNAAGKFYCWGHNFLGQLGTGSLGTARGQKTPSAETLFP